MVLRPPKGTRQKHRKHAGRTRAVTLRNKKKFLTQLARGCTPAVAAQRVGIERTTLP